MRDNGFVYVDFTFLFKTYENSVHYFSWCPNSINDTGINTDLALARANEVITFNTTPSHVQINNILLFGTKYWPYSFAFWIYAYWRKNATLIHMWKPSALMALYMPILGFTVSGLIAALTWKLTQILTITGPIISPNTRVHIAHTYSPSDGIRLFINGTLVASSHVSSTNPSTFAPLTMTLGYRINTTLCSCESVALCGTILWTDGRISILLSSAEFQWCACTSQLLISNDLILFSSIKDYGRKTALVCLSETSFWNYLVPIYNCIFFMA